MNIIKEYENLDAIALANLVKEKQVSAKELLETAIMRIENYNPDINAVVNQCYDKAYAQLNSININAPFAGVPFLLKDLGVFYKDVVTSFGSHLFQNFTPTHNSEIVKRFLQAGCVIVGKSNTPEFGTTYTTEPKLFGPCRNPWDLNKTPGGSSGGAAAAVAARIIPVAHATDGGGSIRVPASCCGIFGLKPTRARVPAGPDLGEGWSGLACGHIVSVSVRDSAVMLDAISGPEIGDPYAAPTQVQPFKDALTTPLKSLKIAVMTENLYDLPVDDECKTAVDETVKLCHQLGHTVEADKINADVEQLAFAVRVIVSANIANLIHQRELGMGRKITQDDIEPSNFAFLQLGKTFTAQDYAHALISMHRQVRIVAHFFEKYDMLLTPVTAKPAVNIGELQLNNLGFDEYLKLLGTFAPYTSLFNQTGQPAMSVPLHWTQNNLPVGVQFVGRFGDEFRLLQLAAQLEQAKPWKDKKPGLIL